MPFTVITLQTVPLSLKGDLTKWMQEIATGVYVGNFNVKVREQLWKRVVENVGCGQATLSYSYRNEIGYDFQTYNTQRQVIDSDGIPLVLIQEKSENEIEYGFSKASNYRKSKKFHSEKSKNKKSQMKPFVVLDIETTGLDENENEIIEIGAIKYYESKTYTFHRLIKLKGKLPKEITNITGITEKMLDKGKNIEISIIELKEFIGKLPIVGYVIDFDMRFINRACKKLTIEKITNEAIDLAFYVKKEKPFLDNYKLQTVIQQYKIEKKVPHRALEDAKLELELALKIEKFVNRIKK
ncbi:MAG: type I-E CRISPR-associated endoribonuclease Cas2e [Staphylococcus epidermidis]|nr:type I-E CRISPR-associated endoribonuclease Cas2e [Staphylococcus epidermidis]